MRNRRFLVGPLLLFAALSLYKSVVLAPSARLVWHVGKFDLALLAALLPFALLAGGARRRAVRLLAHGALLAGLVVFALHVVSLVLFDQNLTLSNLVDFVPEWRFALRYLRPVHALLFLGAAGLYLLRLPVAPPSARQAALAVLVLAAVGLWPLRSTPETVKKYAIDARDLLARARGRSPCPPAYPRREAEASRRELAAAPLLDLAPPYPNIVLVIAESLSAVDSLKTSGITNRLPRFDRIAADGMLFTNFIANYYQTNGAMVALINATAPVPFPQGRVPMLSAFGVQRSVVRELGARGYHSEFLTTTPLWFENVRSWAPLVGYDLAEGYEEIPSFRGKPTFSCGVCADSELVDAALARVRRLRGAGRPFFLTLLTTTSHVPWLDPLRRGDNEQNVFDYVDQQLERLHLGLKAARFYDEGLLVIVGDHRKPSPILPEERRRFGASAKARVPLAVVGRGIPRGAVNAQFFQQADLLRRLEALKDPQKPLSARAVFVDHYARRVWQDAPRANLDVLLAADLGRGSHTAQVDGTCLAWTGNAPAERAEIERELHASRAAHQAVFAGSASACRIPPSATRGLAPATRGAELRLFPGTDLGGDLPGHSRRLLGRAVVPEIWFEDFRAYPGLPAEGFTAELRTELTVPEGGQHWFNVESADGVCLAIDGQMIIDAAGAKPLGEVAGHALLEKGRHLLVLRTNGGNRPLRLSWVARPSREFWTRTEKQQWQRIPPEALAAPAP